MWGSAQQTDLLVSSRDNARVRRLRTAFAEGGRRAVGEPVAIEGENLLQEAVRSGLQVQMVFVSERRALPAWLPRATPYVRLADAVFASAVETRAPQGLAALVVPPAFSLADVLRAEAPLVLIAAGLQDPGNLGTLIRSAEAFAAAGVLLTPGTVNPWNGKAVRSSAGSVFRTPVVSCEVDDVRALPERGITLLAAVRGDSEQDIRSIGDTDLVQGVAVMVGNEGAGLTQELLALADTRVTIPCPGPVESLNAAIAGSIVLYEASRQRRTARPAGGHR